MHIATLFLMMLIPLLYCILPYAVGMLFAGIFTRKPVKIFIWVLPILIIMGLTYLTYDYFWGTLESDLYYGHLKFPLLIILTILLAAQCVIYWKSIRATIPGSPWKIVAVSAFVTSLILLDPTAVFLGSISKDRLNNYLIVRERLAEVGYMRYPGSTLPRQTIRPVDKAWLCVKSIMVSFSTDDDDDKVLDFYEALADDKGFQVRRGLLKSTGVRTIFRGKPVGPGNIPIDPGVPAIIATGDNRVGFMLEKVGSEWWYIALWNIYDDFDEAFARMYVFVEL